MYKHISIKTCFKSLILLFNATIDIVFFNKRVIQLFSFWAIVNKLCIFHPMLAPARHVTRDRSTGRVLKTWRNYDGTVYSSLHKRLGLDSYGALKIYLQQTRALHRKHFWNPTASTRLDLAATIPRTRTQLLLRFSVLSFSLLYFLLPGSVC